MRLNISYSIDLEEVPEKVKEILQKDISKVKREALPSLDEAVEKCYRPKPFTSDEERLEHLFTLYEEMTENEPCLI